MTSGTQAPAWAGRERFQMSLHSSQIFAGITPIREIAGLKFKPAALTEQLMSDFSALTRRTNV